VHSVFVTVHTSLVSVGKPHMMSVATVIPGTLQEEHNTHW